eukprot:scaffold111590_cov18-Tisochrysis_lutea.AAC.2
MPRGVWWLAGHPEQDAPSVLPPGCTMRLWASSFKQGNGGRGTPKADPLHLQPAAGVHNTSCFFVCTRVALVTGASVAQLCVRNTFSATQASCMLWGMRVHWHPLFLQGYLRPAAPADHSGVHPAPANGGVHHAKDGQPGGVPQGAGNGSHCFWRPTLHLTFIMQKAGSLEVFFKVQKRVTPQEAGVPESKSCSIHDVKDWQPGGAASVCRVDEEQDLCSSKLAATAKKASKEEADGWVMYPLGAIRSRES